MTEYTFIHLPSRRKKERSKTDLEFGDLLWKGKFKKGKYRFTRQGVREKWGIDLLDLSGASRLFLPSVPTWYIHLSHVLDAYSAPHILMDLIDSDVEPGKDNQEEFERRLPHSEIYLLSPVNNNTLICFEVIDFLRRNRKGSKIIVGGPQATFEDIEFLEKGADIVVRGEGERTFEQLVRGDALSSIKGISYSEKGNIRQNPPQEIIENLNDLPFYDWKNQPAQYNPSFYRRFFAQRGCPMNCCFCSDTLWANKKVRRKSIERLEQEIDSTTQHTKFLEFHIADNCLSSSKEFSMEFAELLSKYPFDWTGETRVDMVDQETLDHLAKSGCVELEYGAESSIDDILRKSDKRITRDMMIRAFEMTKKAGINVHTNWMVGLPGETKETALKTIDFVCEMTKRGLIDTMNHVILVPYPGTPIVTNPQQYGIRVLTKDWAQYNEDGLPVYEMDGISRQDTYDVWEYGNQRYAEILAKHHNSMLE